jgi:hypothetical protein
VDSDRNTGRVCGICTVRYVVRYTGSMPGFYTGTAVCVRAITVESPSQFFKLCFCLLITSQYYLPFLSNVDNVLIFNILFGQHTRSFVTCICNVFTAAKRVAVPRTKHMGFSNVQFPLRPDCGAYEPKPVVKTRIKNELLVLTV